MKSIYCLNVSVKRLIITTLNCLRHSFLETVRQSTEKELTILVCQACLCSIVSLESECRSKQAVWWFWALKNIFLTFLQRKRLIEKISRLIDNENNYNNYSPIPVFFRCFAKLVFFFSTFEAAICFLRWVILYWFYHWKVICKGQTMILNLTSHKSIFLVKSSEKADGKPWHNIIALFLILILFSW